jgi:hypothetical protein
MPQLPLLAADGEANEPGRMTPEAGPIEAPASLRRTAPEEYSPNLYRRAGLDLGVAVYGNFDSSLQVSAPGMPGVAIDMEDLLGLDDSVEVLRLDAYYSFNRRHRVDLSFYDIDRDGRRALADDISFGGIVIPAGSSVDSMFDTLILKLAYRYNFVADHRTTIGASFGLHVMGLETELATSGGSVAESFGVDAPLPNVGLHFAYALSPRWKLYLSTELLQFDIGDYEAYFNDNRLGIEHDFSKHLGWGLGFNGQTLDGAFTDGSLDGDIEYAYQGVILYLRGYL